MGERENEAPTVEEVVERLNFIAETNPFDATRQWCADAASLLTTLQAERDRLVAEQTAEFSEMAAAIGMSIDPMRFLDPPDGGEVPLPEQVRRMGQALVAAEAERDALRTRVERLKGVLERCRVFAEGELSERGIEDTDYPAHLRAGWVIDLISALSQEGQG